MTIDILLKTIAIALLFMALITMPILTWLLFTEIRRGKK